MENKGASLKINWPMEYLSSKFTRIGHSFPHVGSNLIVGMER